jgi:uncharacterized protein YabE (DUF348 family)
MIRKSVTPFGALVAAALFLVAITIIIISGVTHATDSADTTVSDRGRLITIYDRGTEKVITSHALTVGDAVKEANITLDSKDAVEPAVTEKLVASGYKVNIYRARPVIIVDGNIRQKVMTPYQTADQIASSAGITIYPEDKTAISRVDNLTEGAGLQLVITRAIPFTFTLYGKTTSARTLAKTVGDMLVEKGIKLSKDDRVLPSEGTILTEGLAVRVWREGKQTITVDEPIVFDTQQIKDADREVGYLSVTIPGDNGMRSVSYEIMIQDGKEVNRTEIASITNKQPKTQVQVVGAKGEYTTPSENESITWDFLISQGFSRPQVAGIMGNLQQENQFKTTDTTGGLGIAQWTSGRRLALLALAYPENIYTQLSFLMSELRGSYTNAYNGIKSAGTIDQAEYAFQKYYEGCGDCRESQRIKFAYDIYTTFAGQ